MSDRRREVALYFVVGKIETVIVGGESDLGSRAQHYDWVKQVCDACEQSGVQMQAQGRGKFHC